MITENKEFRDFVSNLLFNKKFDDTTNKEKGKMLKRCCVEVVLLSYVCSFMDKKGYSICFEKPSIKEEFKVKVNGNLFAITVSPLATAIDISKSLLSNNTIFANK